MYASPAAVGLEAWSAGLTVGAGFVAFSGVDSEDFLFEPPPDDNFFEPEPWEALDVGLVDFFSSVRSLVSVLVFFFLTVFALLLDLNDSAAASRENDATDCPDVVRGILCDRPLRVLRTPLQRFENT